MRARPRTIPARLSPREAQQIAASFLAARRKRHGTATMTAPVTETTTTEKTEPVEQTTTETTKTETEPAKFTQADLDRVLQTRLADEQAKWQKKLDDAAALAGKNETEKLTIERDQANQRATEARDKAASRVAQTEAKVAAIAAGANPERVAAIVRNADLAAAVKDGEVDEAAIKAAVDKVLSEYPEWKAKPGGPTASGGELNGGGGDGKPSFTRKQLEEMPPEEMARRIDEVNDAIANGRVTG